MKACELRIALVKICRKMFVYFSFDDLFFAPFVKEPLLPKAVFVGISLFFFYSLSFVKLEELVTAGQSLLRISIAFWASVASLRIAYKFDVIVFLALSLLASLRLISLFLHYLGVQGCLMT